MLFKEGIKGANPEELGELFFTLKSTPWNTLHAAAREPELAYFIVLVY